jgi:N-acetylmuramoyl-L-alanine amidase
MGMTKAGVSESEVVSLQNHLKTLGLYAGPITGYFGPTTKKAVEAYQKKNGLSALGVVGPSTRTLLNQGK